MLADGVSEKITDVSQSMSDKVTDVTRSVSEGVSEASVEVSRFAEDQLTDMVSTLSLAGNLARSLGETKSLQDERLERFGDPASTVKEDDEEFYIPRHRRRRRR